MLAATLFGVWPIMENRHFESSVRLQRDREHKVCSTGPYAYIRHPGYSAIVLWGLSMPMIFGPPVWIVTAAILVIMVTRTWLEDKFLQNSLPGYQNYAGNVRYRLIPYIW